MTPGNPFVRTLAALRIVPVKDGIPSATASDGVVEYMRAPIDGVGSPLGLIDS